MKLNSLLASAIVSVVSLLIGAIVGGLFLGGLFTGSFTANNKLTHRVFSVAAANDEWTQTNITVSPGDILITNEPGNKITVSKTLDAVGVDGLGDGWRALDMKLRAVVSGAGTDVGVLFLKIGVGPSIKIGIQSHIKVNDPGVVKLRVSDTDYSDNSGNFMVDIIHIPASLIPAEQVVKQ